MNKEGGEDEPIILSVRTNNKKLELSQSDMELIEHFQAENQERENDLLEFHKAVAEAWNRWRFVYHSNEEPIEHFLEETKRLVTEYEQLKKVEKQCKDKLKMYGENNV
jgi:thiamine biosynthesis lipoprotein ApbE